MVMANDNLRIEYPTVSLGDLRVVAREADDDRPAGPAQRRAVAVHVRGEPLEPSARFWSSLFHRFGISENIFRYFRHDEVFARIVDRNPDDRLRLCVERVGDKRNRLLACSNPKRPVLTYDQASTLLTKHHGDEGGPTYHTGLLTSTHTPKSGERGFDIGPDRFHNRFVVEAPVDGFGQPRIYLSLLRQVCSNGAVGYARSFRSDVRIGDDTAYTLERALGQFDHDEGFTALRQRFEIGPKVLGQPARGHAPAPHVGPHGHRRERLAEGSSTPSAAICTPCTAWPTSTACRPSGSASSPRGAGCTT